MIDDYDIVSFAIRIFILGNRKPDVLNFTVGCL